MSKTVKTSLALLAALIGFVFYTFQTTGFFRTIENQSLGDVHVKIPIVGPEDIAISYTDSFLIVSSFDRAALRDGQEKQGGLYYIDLRDPSFTPKHLTDNFAIPFAPHGISIYPKDSAQYEVYAISHAGGKHSIEYFELYGDSLVHQKSIQDESMISPNDVVAVGDGRFYFSNDKQYTSTIGKLAEEYLGLAVTNVIYFDGNVYREIDDGIAYANGINYDPNRNLLFLAAPRAFLIKVYEIQEDGTATFVEDIDCQTGVDNIEFDQSGKIWIGCHPNLLEFAAYAGGKKPIAPSELITIDYRGKGDYDIESVYTDRGENVSASTVATVFGPYIFIGNVMDGHVLVLKK